MKDSVTSPCVDAHVLRYLKTLPCYEHWSGEALPHLIDHYLRHADRQQVMTAVAMGLSRLLDQKD